MQGLFAYSLRKDVLEIELLKYKALFLPTERNATLVTTLAEYCIRKSSVASMH